MLRKSVPDLTEGAVKILGVGVLLLAPGMLGGCFVVLPTIPLNAPGYGHTYELVDANNQTVGSGHLVMMSKYWAAPPMINRYEIDSGKACVPVKLGTRYAGTWWCALGTPIIGYAGMFHNPHTTQVWALVPGYVPADWTWRGWDQGRQDGLHPPPDVIPLVGADSDVERRFLQDFSDALPNHPDATREDKLQRGWALAYVQERLRELPTTQPAGGRGSAAPEK